MPDDHGRLDSLEGIVRRLVSMLVQQEEFNRQQVELNRQQREINADIKTTLARIDALLARIIERSANGRDA